MNNERKSIKEEVLDNVVGGLFYWHKDTQVMDYTHKDGTVTYHQILDYEKGWEMSNNLHGQKVPEDDILKRLIDNHYIEA